MAIIHDTTMSPGKLELMTAWLPAQPWYHRTGHEPELTKAGGFRLDDPQGEVGIEFMVVTDGSGVRATTYQVPLTYRAGALADAEGGLIGTSEHGVLGRRWIYDGIHDPVFLAQFVALVQGEAEPQAQSLSNAADPTVTSQPVVDGSLAPTRSAVAANGPSGTELRVETARSNGAPTGELILRISRILQPGDGSHANHEAGTPCLSAPWRLPDGTRVRGVFATARYAPSEASPHPC
jgi:Maltokinase N-terminal cap domain